MRALVIISGFAAVVVASHYLKKRQEKEKATKLGSVVCEAWMKSAGKTVARQT